MFFSTGQSYLFILHLKYSIIYFNITIIFTSTSKICDRFAPKWIRPSKIGQGFCTILEMSTIATSILNIFCIKWSLQHVVDNHMLSVSLWRLSFFCVFFNVKSTSGKFRSNIPRVFNAHEPQQQHYTMSYSSFFIHQPQLSLFNSSQPFLFCSIRRVRDCRQRITTFLHLVHST